MLCGRTLNQPVFQFEIHLTSRIPPDMRWKQGIQRIHPEWITNFKIHPLLNLMILLKIMKFPNYLKSRFFI